MPKTVTFDKDELEDVNVNIILYKLPDNLSDKYLNEREKYHFILIVSETEYFKEYEDKYYKEKITELEKKQMLYGLQTVVTKVLDPKSIKNIDKNVKSKNYNDIKNKIIEYDNTKNLINNFVKKSYPYISYIYGGFKEIHNYILKLNIPLLFHEENNCYICIENSRKSQKNNGLLSRIFNWKRSKYF